MARGGAGYRTWGATDRFQADMDLRNMQQAVAIARKILWDAMKFAPIDAEVVRGMKADLARLQQRQAQIEAEVARIEETAFALVEEAA